MDGQDALFMNLIFSVRTFQLSCTYFSVVKVTLTFTCFMNIQTDFATEKKKGHDEQTRLLKKPFHLYFKALHR